MIPVRPACRVSDYPCSKDGCRGIRTSIRSLNLLTAISVLLLITKFDSAFAQARYTEEGCLISAVGIHCPDGEAFPLSDEDQNAIESLIARSVDGPNIQDLKKLIGLLRQNRPSLHEERDEFDDYDGLASRPDPIVHSHLTQVLTYWSDWESQGLLSCRETTNFSCKDGDLLAEVIRETANSGISAEANLAISQHLGHATRWVRYIAAEALELGNWNPAGDADTASRYYCARFDTFSKCKAISESSAGLITEYNDPKSANNDRAACELAKRSDSVAQELSGRLWDWEDGGKWAFCVRGRWKPSSLEERVALAVAVHDRQAIESEWPDSRNVIYRSLIQRDTREAAANALVWLGKEETIPKLISALNTYSTIDIANVLIRSGHDELEGAAREWAKHRSVKVMKTGGNSSTARWGGP